MSERECVKNHHQYLNDLGVKSDEICIFNTQHIDEDRQKRFEEEREKYGFDDRETWALNYTMLGWLYSHLKMFEEIGGEIVDLTFHKFKIPVLTEIPQEELKYESSPICAEEYYREITEEHTQLEAIHIMEEYLEWAIKHFDDFDENECRSREKARCALRIFAEILPAMWW